MLEPVQSHVGRVIPQNLVVRLCCGQFQTHRLCLQQNLVDVPVVIDAEGHDQLPVALDQTLHGYEQIALGVRQTVSKDGRVAGLVVPGAGVEIVVDIEGQSVDHVRTKVS